jgi:hypothetical protein
MMAQIIETLARDEGILLGAILGTLGILGGTGIAVTAIITDTWRRVRQTEDNNALKQSMLDRGMSADEIATVMKAAPEKRGFYYSAGRGGMRCRT